MPVRLMLSEKGECEIDQWEINTERKVIFEGLPPMAGGIWKECPQGNDCLKHFELRAENNRTEIITSQLYLKATAKKYCAYPCVCILNMLKFSKTIFKNHQTLIC